MSEYKKALQRAAESVLDNNRCGYCINERSLPHFLVTELVKGVPIKNVTPYHFPVNLGFKRKKNTGGYWYHPDLVILNKPFYEILPQKTEKGTRWHLDNFQKNIISFAEIKSVFDRYGNKKSRSAFIREITRELDKLAEIEDELGIKENYLIVFSMKTAKWQADPITEHDIIKCWDHRKKNRKRKKLIPFPKHKLILVPQPKESKTT